MYDEKSICQRNKNGKQVCSILFLTNSFATNSDSKILNKVSYNWWDSLNNVSDRWGHILLAVV